MYWSAKTQITSRSAPPLDENDANAQEEVGANLAPQPPYQQGKGESLLPSPAASGEGTGGEGIKLPSPAASGEGQGVRANTES